MNINEAKQFDEEIRPYFLKFWDLKPEGIEGEAFFHFKAVIKNKKFKGNNITGEWLFKRYESYIESLKPLQAGKYTKKENKILSPIDFLIDEVYMQPIRQFKDPLDFYLYGIE